MAECGKPDVAAKGVDVIDTSKRRLDARLVVSIVACGVMSFAGVVAETAMNVAFPVLMSEFGVDTASVQWITTGYLLVLTVIMPLSSYLKKRFRMRALFITAEILFICGTVLCMLAPVFPVLILGRVVQGIGTGLALPLMFNIVIEQAPLDKMGLMMGVATLITATAPAVGPSVGGLIVTTMGWRMIFAILLPFLAASFIAGVLTIRQIGDTKKTAFGFGQFVVLGCAFASLVFATSSASTAGWLSAEVLGLIAVSIVLLAAFVVLSRRSAAPLIRVDIFKSRSYTLSVLFVVLFQAIVLGLGYLLPYYGQVVGGLNEFEGGCLLLPGCIVGAILAPFGGRILDVLGARGPITAGSIIQLVGIALFAFIGLAVDPVFLALIYVLIPVSQGLSMANSITNGLRYLPEDLRTDGNATNNTLQQLGGALGTAIATSVVNGAQASSSDLVAGTLNGTGLAFEVLLGMAAVAFVLVLCVFAGRGSRKGARG